MTFVEQVQQFWLRNAKIRNGQIPDYPLHVESRTSPMGKILLILALICFGLALAMLAPIIVEWFRSFMDEPAAVEPAPQTQQESLYQYLEDSGQNIPITE